MTDHVDICTFWLYMMLLPDQTWLQSSGHFRAVSPPTGSLWNLQPSPFSRFAAAQSNAEHLHQHICILASYEGCLHWKDILLVSLQQTGTNVNVPKHWTEPRRWPSKRWDKASLLVWTHWQKERPLIFNNQTQSVKMTHKIKYIQEIQTKRLPNNDMIKKQNKL